MSSAFSRRVIARTIAEKLTTEPTKARHWLKVLAAYLIENNLVDDADLLAKDITREVFEQTGELAATVVSARPLSETLRDDIKAMLRTETGAKKVLLKEETDASLLGGFIAQTSDAEIDASVRARLQQLAAIK